MEKTKDYKMFKLRSDNREQINKARVSELADSIKENNLLHLRPIIVNKDMEVLAGQHRLLAAEKLGVDVYYQVQDLTAVDMLHLSNEKGWRITDYHNFFVKNGYIEYQKLDEFLKENDLALSIGLRIVMSQKGKVMLSFKRGEFVFDPQVPVENIASMKKTVELLERLKGKSAALFSKSAKFWTGLGPLVNHPFFIYEVFENNLIKLVERVGVRATAKDYTTMFFNIYNFGTVRRISPDDAI